MSHRGVPPPLPMHPWAPVHHFLFCACDRPLLQALGPCGPQGSHCTSRLGQGFPPRHGGSLVAPPPPPQRPSGHPTCNATSALPHPLCDFPSDGCFFTGPWTVTRSSLRMLRRVAAFCRPLRPMLPLVSFSHCRARSWRTGLCWLLWGSLLGVCYPLPPTFWSSTTCLPMFLWACGLSGCYFFTGHRIVTRSSLHVLRRVAAFWQLLRPVFPCSCWCCFCVGGAQ